jgi:cold shock CspA family protein
VQGVIKSYDPTTRAGVLVDDRDRAERELSPEALEGSVFRMLRQGQRVVYDIDGQGLATKLRLGSEVDLGAPDWGDSASS